MAERAAAFVAGQVAGGQQAHALTVPVLHVRAHHLLRARTEDHRIMLQTAGCAVQSSIAAAATVLHALATD